MTKMSLLRCPPLLCLISRMSHTKMSLSKMSPIMSLCHLSFVICHLSFIFLDQKNSFCNLSFVVCHLSFVIQNPWFYIISLLCHSLFVIRLLSFVVCHSLSRFFLKKKEIALMTNDKLSFVIGPLSFVVCVFVF